MIDDFLVRNLTTEDRVTFGKDTECDYICQTVDWGSVAASHNTYNYPSQVGVSVFSTKINSRDIYITGYVYYSLSEDELKTMVNKNERREYAYEKIKEKKKVLNDVFNPNDFVRISTEGYYIEGKPNASVKYGVEESENNTYFCKFDVSIFCANPMFKKETKVLKTLSGDLGMFHFSWILKPTGNVMGSRVDYLMIKVENEGNVEIGGKITIVAKGEVQNPKLVNPQTDEFIRINKTMQKGDRIEIVTIDGDKRGIVGFEDGIEKKYLKYWDFDSTWLKFGKGTTTIEYYSDNQAEDMMDITIEINPEKYGLEEM